MQVVESLPVTRVAVGLEEARRLKRYVQQTEEIVGWIPDVRVARLSDAPVLTRLFVDHDVGPWIYTMPQPITEDSVRDFILRHLHEREEGDGVLFIAFDAQGEAAAYFDVELWAEWGACKFGGAVKPQRQGKGYGGATTLAAVDWCFNQLGVERICETTGLDNQRSIRLLSRIGFTEVARTISRRPDGSSRPSIVWELERSAWRTPRLRVRPSATLSDRSLSAAAADRPAQ